MSGPWFARPIGWGLGRVSHSARVAGAHLAAAGRYLDDAGAGLVPAVKPSRRLALSFGPKSRSDIDRFNRAFRHPMGPAVRRTTGDEAALGEDGTSTAQNAQMLV